MDLSYITPQLIAMGYPTEGRESAYRNPYKQVFAFLEKRHSGCYKVYNLCSEKNRQYDPVKFNDSVACYPFEDHHPPPFDLIEQFCKDVKAYLAESDKNIAAIHCKGKKNRISPLLFFDKCFAAGKGRTGTMIICYLLYAHFYSDPDHAKRYYAAMRTYNRKGLTIPSQIRYVDYFYLSLRNRAFVEALVPPTLVLVGFKLAPPPFLDKLDQLRFTVHCNRALVYEHKHGLTVDNGMVALAKSVSMAKLEEDGGAGGPDKLPKEMPCASCGAVHKAKLSLWYVCGLCGRDTCANCTDKKTVGEAPRLVCGACSKDQLEKAGSVLSEMDARVLEKFNAAPPKSDDTYALIFKPEKPVAVKGDVRVSVWHTGPKPLVHFWINTRFHSQFPIVLEKQQIDGSDKDLKHKRFPADFRIVADFRQAEAGEAVLPLASDPRDKKKMATTVSGVVVQPNGFVLFNKELMASGDNVGAQVDLKIAASLLEAAIRIVTAHSVDSTEGGSVFSIDSAASVASDLDYNALLGRLSLLSAVTLKEASREECLAFWLNAYHLLLIVSMVELYPYTPKDRVKNARNCHLCVCGEKLTLLQLEFSILRAAHALPSVPSTLIGGNLPKRHAKLAVEEGDVTPELQQLISFGISYACPGTPAMRVYSGATLLNELKENGAAYLRKWGIVVKKTVLVSAYLEWFQCEADTAKPLAASIDMWVQLVSPNLGAEAAELLKAAQSQKIKLEDNVQLDEIVFFFPGKTETAAAGDGLHFAAMLSPRANDDKGKVDL